MKRKIVLFLLCSLFVREICADVYSGKCGDNAQWKVDTEIESLVITGTGMMSDYAMNRTPWDWLSEYIRFVWVKSGITSIGEYAFYDLDISTASISETVKTIGNYAFCGCDNLQSISLSITNIVEIGKKAFSESGLTSLSLPASVTKIGDNAFAMCESLSTVVLNSGLSTIGERAFVGCTNLTSITIPNTITSIGKYAFCDCRKLESASILNNANISCIPQGMFDGCNSLRGFTVNKGVKSIGSYAFGHCYNIAKVELPYGLKSIEDHAFYNCSNLNHITIPEGVASIGDGAFMGCKLYSITFPASVESLGLDILSQCYYLESVYVNCPFTRALFWPYADTSDGGYAYNGVIPNLKYVYIGNGVKEVPYLAFSGYTNLLSVTIPESVTRIWDSAFSGCSSLSSITIPEGVTSIGEEAFRSCSKLASITLPEGVSSIGYYAFYGCSSLASITLPETVTSIDGYAFAYCSSLTSITLPESVTSIGNYAFSACNSLTDMYFKNNPSKGSGAIPSTTKLHLSLSEGANFISTNANTYADATYERALADGKYGTIIFPFAIDDDTKSCYEFYELDGQEDGRLNFTPVDDPQPGTPYLYKNAEGKKADCFTSGARVTICTTMSDKDAGDGWTMKGNYESLVITDADELDVTYYLSNNKVMNATTSLTLKPFRAYFQGPSYAATFADAGVKSIAIRTGEGTTLVSPETMEEVPTVYYDLSGRSVANPQSGIYIVNGKKLMVK